MAAPVRGARILLTDDRSVRADMTASWLAQMGWETYVLDGGYDGALEAGPEAAWRLAERHDQDFGADRLRPAPDACEPRRSRAALPRMLRRRTLDVRQRFSQLRLRSEESPK